MEYKNEYFDKVTRLADYLTATIDPKMKWMWGEALLGYSLDELDRLQNTEKYTDFLKKYCDIWYLENPSVTDSDTAAPALITYAMYKRTGDERYKALTDKALDYIKNEPRLYLDCLNHLGNGKKSKIYPKSVWIDSVMMFSVFTSLYASENGDSELLSFAARQPAQYAEMMRDEKTGLWSHSFWVKNKRRYPKNVFWARGNGWVVAAFPMILDNIGESEKKAEIIELLSKTAKAVVSKMNPDFSFNTLLNIKSYRELSATALISAGLMHAVRCGYIDDAYRETAVRMFYTVVDAIKERDGGLFMPEISGPTIPVPLFPTLGYKLVPRGENWSYGIAALIFAAIEYKKLLGEN